MPHPPQVQSGPEEGIALLYRQEAFQELATSGFYFRDHAFGSREAPDSCRCDHMRSLLQPLS